MNWKRLLNNWPSGFHSIYYFFVHIYQVLIIVQKMLPFLPSNILKDLISYKLNFRIFWKELATSIKTNWIRLGSQRSVPLVVCSSRQSLPDVYHCYLPGLQFCLSGHVWNSHQSERKAADYIFYSLVVLLSCHSLNDRNIAI